MRIRWCIIIYPGHLGSHYICVISHTDTSMFTSLSSDPDVIILSESHVASHLALSVIVSINKAFISLFTRPILLIFT